ncbi:MAG: C25 family cysteine peptidase [Bacteroidales bacterium]|nr:C25 family cysteine peptidase [Bacteroidales bacterium]
MKKILLTLLTMVLFLFAGFAQQGVIPLSSEKNAVEMSENSYEKLNLTFNHSQIRSFTVKTSEGTFDEISIPGARFTGNIGDPKLPAYSKLIEVPFGAEVNVKVKNYTVQEYKLSDFGINNLIIPAQPDVNKSEDPTKVKFRYNKAAYASKTYSAFNMADVEIQGTMRGVRIAKLSVSPVNYNPTDGTVKVYNNIEVEVIFTNSNVSKTEYIKQATYSPFFESVYSKLLNTKTVIDDHPDLTKYPVKMLILADRMFETALAPYILWKTKKGFNVIVNYTDEGYSDVASIKAWVQSHYDAGTPTDPAPSFCLFVGDVAQIPSSQVGVNSGKQTDLYYFSQDGDYFPEMYYGRFSANNLTELQPIIDKTLYHERYEFADPTYLDDVTLIAGADATWNPNVGQPTIQYGTQNYFNASHGFTNVNDYLSSYTGCYDNARISVSFINYTAHCAETVWADPGLSISDINSMTNTNKYPLAVGNCCLSADFGYLECIGEAWIRAENKGAVAYIGSSPSSYWFEDFYWAVGAFPIQGDNGGYVPTFGETTYGVYDGMFVSDYVTVDATVFLGNLAVTEVDVAGYPQHSNPLYYWEAYNCLGDPSLVPFYTQGSTNTVSHMAILPIGMSTYTVDAEPGSYVAISKDGILHGAALVDATGTVDVPIIPVTSGGDVDIVVTKPQYIPYMTTVPAAALSGPYMIVNTYNNVVDYGQTINLDIALENVGADPATGVSATVSTSDVNASIANPTFVYGDVTVGTVTAPSSGVFTLTVADNLPDQYMVAVDISITDGTDTWDYTKNVTVNAPAISIGSVFITNDDNADGILDPAETADINFTITNSGHATAVFNGTLSESNDPNNYLTLGGTFVSGVSLAAGASQDFVFTGATADVATPLGSPVEVQIDIAAGASNQYTGVDNQNIIIGIIPVYLISDAGPYTVCTGTFYDSGGETGEYASSENETLTFLPGGGEDFVVVEFTEFATEGGYDYLYIHDGPDTSYPQVAGSPFDEDAPPTGPFMGANGLTFHFTSDASVTRSGWAADVYCFSATTPPACSINPVPSNGATNVFPLNISWSSAMGATSYDVYFGTDPDPYTNTPVTVTSTEFAITVNPETTYYWAVLPTNSIGTATGCDVWSFNTGGEQYPMTSGTVTICNAAFYDTGGANGAYQSDENITMTFLPGTAGKMINVEFVSFATEGGYDYLYVYDATDATNLIGQYDEDNMPPTNITATNADGALTFVFTSDGSVTRDGWVTNITCVDGVATYTITFDVNDGTNAIEGAAVNFDSQTINTDASGIAVFNNCAEGTGVAYTVTKNGYNNATGAVDTDADKTINVIMASNAVETLENNISIIPNPNNGMFAIDFGELNTSEITVEVRTVSGKVIYQSGSTSNVHQIDLSNQSKGIYFIRINSGEIIYNTKVMIK